MLGRGISCLKTRQYHDDMFSRHLPCVSGYISTNCRGQVLSVQEYVVNLFTFLKHKYVIQSVNLMIAY